jgi:hypothetical protein
VIELFAAAALAPWAQPLRFGPLAGWQRGASGTVPSLYDNASSRVRAPRMSTAWIATRNVRYRDSVTSDPPNRTLMHLPRDGVIVWAVVYQSRPGRLRPIRLDLRRARRYACCEGAYLTAGSYELVGLGPGRAYAVIVRIYFGSRPDGRARARAQRALDRLELPPRR